LESDGIVPNLVGGHGNTLNERWVILAQKTPKIARGGKKAVEREWKGNSNREERQA